jgi:pyridoxamine 5'-phosphate oxidase
MRTACALPCEAVVTEHNERTLSEADLDPDPYAQFRTWLHEAIESGEPMPNAMAVATCSAEAVPSVRMILLEEVDERGFTFQTNIESPKARDLAAVPRAALAFFWPILLRQVRITGTVEPLSRDEVATYYAAAPSPIQAMLRACRQGEVIPDRAALERAYAQAVAADAPPALPDHWGGYRVSAETIEFWQGRQNRLQDRLRYTRAGAGWRIERLVP